MGASLCIGLLLGAAQPPQVEPLKAWEGSVENAGLQKIAPPFLTTAEGLGILWKAWGRADAVPEVDFEDDFVVVTTGTGGVLKTKYLLNPDGELSVISASTRDLKPGFRYNLAVLPRAGVAKVDGKVLPGVVADAPAPTAVPYKPDAAVEGKLTLTGSVTMSHLAAIWVEGFGKHHPKLKTSIACEGSEDAFADLAGKPGEQIIACVSRPVGRTELESLGKKLGRTVLAFPVCEDDVAVIVHPSNPVKSLTPGQLKSVYTTPAADLTWGILGVDGAWIGRKVALHGRDSKSGTGRFLRTLAVGADGPEPAGTRHASYRKLAEAVAGDPAALGYARAAGLPETVRPVPIGPLADGSTKPFVRRTCSVVVALPDGKTLPPALREFLLFAYRFDGQVLLARDGFEPLAKDTVAEQLQRLGVSDTK
jgi:phosphate transport system substrate-binding protein